MMRTLDVTETPHTGDTVTDTQDTASLLDIAANGRARDAGLEDVRDLCRGWRGCDVSRSASERRTATERRGERTSMKERQTRLVSTVGHAYMHECTHQAWPSRRCGVQQSIHMGKRHCSATPHSSVCTE
jgi:hypothetical protein